MIPYLDMKARHAPMREEFLRAMGRVIDAGEFSGGSFVSDFEQDFAAYCGCAHAVAVGSGTEALWLTLLAMGIGPGDEVITVPVTFMATVEAIRMTGAKPVFVDIDEDSHTMDPASLERALTRNTKAVLPVHLFGQPAAMDRIMTIARQHGLRVVEDAAQAHGADFGGCKAGAIGDAGCFSFHPTKNLGGFGEGGAVVTGDGDLAGRLRMLRNHGQSVKNHHLMRGWNGRMDSIQAAVLRIKLRNLDRDNRARRSVARMYDSGFAGVAGVRTPSALPGRSHVYHVYAVRVPRRRRVLESLASRGIQCGVHYPTPAHLQPSCADLGQHPGDYPVSERCCRGFVSLPIYPELEPAAAGAVVEAVKDALASAATG